MIVLSKLATESVKSAGGLGLKGPPLSFRLEDSKKVFFLNLHNKATSGEPISRTTSR
jgi:hypothetical protein